LSHNGIALKILIKHEDNEMMRPYYVGTMPAMPMPMP
jgi:hypothetical protein